MGEISFCNIIILFVSSVLVHGNFVIFVTMAQEKITIIDVARKAGVSKGTVDRVVHSRGEVSKKSEAKVRKAIEELGYQPNLYASLLASRKTHEIACILPKFGKDEYWEKIYNGFEEGSESVAALGVKTRVFFYNQYDVASFKAACTKVLESKPSGVVLPPLFKNDTLTFAQKLKNLDIPYIYVDTKLEDDGYFSYLGMPMYKSGYLCAYLLTERCTPKDMDKVVIVRILRDKARQSDPTVSRREGFLDYMSEHFPACEILNVFIDPSNPANIEKTLSDFARNHGELRNVVMFNSRIHLIEKYLSAHPLEGRRVIGFDNLDRNLAMLGESLVDIIIAQHTEAQSRNAVRILSDYILMQKRPAVRDAYMHMDILTRLNTDGY